jgi:hypothetical protein
MPLHPQKVRLARLDEASGGKRYACNTPERGESCAPYGRAGPVTKAVLKSRPKRGSVLAFGDEKQSGRFTALEGELTVKRNGQTSVLHQGETAVIEPGAWHDW